MGLQGTRLSQEHSHALPIAGVCLPGARGAGGHVHTSMPASSQSLPSPLQSAQQWRLPVRTGTEARRESRAHGRELGCELQCQVTEQEPDPLSSCLALPRLCQPPAPSQRWAAWAPFPPRAPARPLEAWGPDNSADPGLTRPFIGAGDHQPSGPTAAQVGSPSRFHFRETLPSSACPSPTPASRLLAPQRQLRKPLAQV